MSHYNIITIKDKDMHIVNANDFNNLVSLSITLNPKQSSKNVFGYYYALIEYMEKNPTSELYDSYKCLTTDIIGRYILLSAMEISLMKDRGISLEQMDLYVTKQEQYKKVIKYNNTTYRRQARKAQSM